MTKSMIRVLLLLALALGASGVLIGQGNSLRLASQPAAVTFAGTALLAGSDPNADDGYLGVREGPEVDMEFSKPQLSGTLAPARVPADHVPAPAGSALGSEAVFGFRGITHRDQRLAPTGVPNDSAAVADENGDVWVANEYVPNAPRTLLTNWGTFVAKVHP